MEMVPVGSSSIAAVGYDAESQLLTVAFKSGKVYEYYDVPFAVHDELVAARSVGQHFNQHIRDRYRCSAIC